VVTGGNGGNVEMVTAETANGGTWQWWSVVITGIR
jgi:hypothetical protein